jgi:DNA-binding MarR family transcriptional regulator
VPPTARTCKFSRRNRCKVHCAAALSVLPNDLKYVNMADVNLKAEASQKRHRGRNGTVTDPLSISEHPEITLVELLFFAYRDFISDPDAALLTYSFGRAHHRIIHFVNRHPGIRVADLLDVLKITKQSLGRVLKQLVDSGFIEQRPGPLDRRQRLLYPTESGRALGLRLLDPQVRRIARALAALTPAEREGAEKFLRGIIDSEERAKVADLIGR